jgi:uncharacterized protein (TIGR01777 family)
MNILITGGTGFIAEGLRDMLLKQGHFLTIITRSPEKHESETAQNQQFISWDDDLVSAMEETDVVINLVGKNLATIWTEEAKKEIYSSRVDTTNQIVDAIRKTESRPELMISASGIGYYGDRGDDILDEDEPPGSGFLPRLCVDWEGAARQVEELGVRLVIFRNAVVLEKGGGALQVMLPVFKLGLGGSIGRGRQYFPWIHRLDACRAMDFAITNKELEGACNLTSPNPVTMNELAGTMGEVLHRPAFFRVPEFAVKAVLGEMSDSILDSLRAQPKKLQQAGFEFRFAYLDEALGDIV